MINCIPFRKACTGLPEGMHLISEKCALCKRNIHNPFKRFEDMQMLRHTKTLGIVQVDDAVWRKLTSDEKAEIERICDEKLEKYFSRLA